MKYGCVREFNPLDGKRYVEENKNSVVRDMACEIIHNMSEEDFFKLFEVKMIDRNMAYYSPLVLEVKLLIKDKKK